MTHMRDARYNELIEFQKIHYGAALNKIDVKKNLAELRKYASLAYCVYRCLPSVNTASPSGQPAGVNVCVTARYAAKIKHCIVDTVSLVQGAIARGERVLAEVHVTRDDATSRIRSVCLVFRAKRSHCVK